MPQIQTPADGATPSAALPSNVQAVNRGTAVSAAAGAAQGSDIRRGMAYGLLGVALFALTMPMTRLAVGDTSAPQLPPAFVTAGRAGLAGLLALLYIAVVRAPRPQRPQWRPLAISALCTVVGFPLGLALALREVPSMHASVVTGVIPLATAAVAALATRQRASLGFWVCAVLGCALVLAFALISGGGHWVPADAWLGLAVLCAGCGYVAGAQVTQHMPAEHTICWVLVLALPFTLPAMLLTWPGMAAAQLVRPAAWGGFAYVTLFSMWLGFFAWYRGLALGGVMRVSQVQLAQPFLALLAAVPILGEPLTPTTLGFAVAVVAVVFIGKRMPVRAKA